MTDWNMAGERVMSPWTNGPVTLYTGHVLEVLRGLPAESVQAIITSPPYWGLRDYSLEPVTWDADLGCAHEWGIEQLKSVSPQQDNSGGFIHNRLTTRGEQAWTQATGQVIHAGSTCLRCGAWRGSLGLEPTPQLYVQHLVAVFREVRRVLRSDGVCFLNLGDSYASGGRGGGSDGAKQGTNLGSLLGRKEAPSGLKPKDLVGIPWRVALALQEDGWWLRCDIIWAKPNPMPESVTDRPTRSHEYIFLLTKAATYFWDQEAVREAAIYEGDTRHLRGDLSKLSGGPRADSGSRERTGTPTNGRNMRSVWTIATQPYSGAHFATFPEALVKRCILAGTSERGCCPECGAPWERVMVAGELVADAPGYKPRGKVSPDSFVNVGMKLKGSSQPAPNHHYEKTLVGWRPTCAHSDLAPVPCTVLDPFSGAGTVALVAQKLGRRAIGVDLSPQYTALAVKRLEGVPLPMLTDGDDQTVEEEVLVKLVTL